MSGLCCRGRKDDYDEMAALNSPPTSMAIDTAEPPLYDPSSHDPTTQEVLELGVWQTLEFEVPSASSSDIPSRTSSDLPDDEPWLCDDQSFLDQSLEHIELQNKTRIARSVSAERLSYVFPAVNSEIIEAVIDSVDGDFDHALDQMLEISATPRSSVLHQAAKACKAPPTFHNMTEDIMWIILRKLPDIGIGNVAMVSAYMATVVDSGQSRGLIPPKIPDSIAHIAFSGPRGRAMFSALTTVLITVIDSRTGKLLSVASGSIVRGSNAACYVITSEHNLKSRKGSFDATAPLSDAHILVAVNDSVSRAPKHKFRALLHPSCIDQEADLCVLHLVEVISTVPERGVLEASSDGTKRLARQFTVQSEQTVGPIYGVLHAARIGRIETVSLGAELCVFGFPISGEESITMSEATASGFIGGDWIKLHGNLDNGFSGGAVVLASTGELVGIVSHSRGRVDFARPATRALGLLEHATKVPTARGVEWYANGL